ncbi:MAG: hypothetical protein A2Z03_12405 [Chloroflexi bacterium RBG_16_56_8]|nr:MAG: hypothetical protein A2Z03_12405 [Chloroflexi bacterium RBG_16_56_8]
MNRKQITRIVRNLGRYTLEHSSICLARHCVAIRMNESHRMTYRATKPIYPDAPATVSIHGNFVERSAGFHLELTNRDTIRKLRRAMWANKKRARALA